MQATALLEQALAQMIDGDSRFREVILPLLTHARLEIPIVDQIESGVDTRVKFKTFQNGQRSILPIFTSKGFLQDWGGEKQESISIHGSDLFMLVNRGIFILINPESDLETAFLPLDLEDLKDRSLSFENAVKVYHRLIYSQRIRTGKNSLRQSLVNVVSKVKPLNEVYFSLERRSTESEGYVAEAHLGCVAEALTPWEKYELVAEIAALSKDLFGFAGTIEFYDDLSDPDSPNWANFKSSDLLFRRNRARLADHIEVESVDDLSQRVSFIGSGLRSRIFKNSRSSSIDKKGFTSALFHLFWLRFS